jgi:hypothetical protein
MSKPSSRLSRVLAAGRDGRAISETRESLLAGLLKKRAAARNAGQVDLERQLREHILSALPVLRLREGRGPECALDGARGISPGQPHAPRPGSLARKQPRTPRHSIAWQGELFWDDCGIPVRLRNISAEGAMIAGHANLKPGKEVVLALRSAGAIFATVRWCRQGAVGLKFDNRFDVAKLLRQAGGSAAADSGRSTPGIVKPQYLRSETEADSPWAARWERLRPEDL